MYDLGADSLLDTAFRVACSTVQVSRDLSYALKEHVETAMLSCTVLVAPASTPALLSHIFLIPYLLSAVVSLLVLRLL